MSDFFFSGVISDFFIIAVASSDFLESNGFSVLFVVPVESGVGSGAAPGGGAGGGAAVIGALARIGAMAGNSALGICVDDSAGASRES